MSTKMQAATALRDISANNALKVAFAAEGGIENLIELAKKNLIELLKEVVC